MTAPRHPRAGLTLIEVMIALLILTVGVLAAAGMQATALGATRTAEVVQTLNAAARRELETARGRTIDATLPTALACGSGAAGCGLEVRPCLIDSAGALDFPLSLVADPVAHAITVTATNGARSVALRTVVMR